MTVNKKIREKLDAIRDSVAEGMTSYDAWKTTPPEDMDDRDDGEDEAIQAEQEGIRSLRKPLALLMGEEDGDLNDLYESANEAQDFLASKEGKEMGKRVLGSHLKAFSDLIAVLAQDLPSDIQGSWKALETARIVAQKAATRAGF